MNPLLRSARLINRATVILVLAVLITPSALSGVGAAAPGHSGSPTSGGDGWAPAPSDTPPEPVWREVDTLSTIVEVPPGEYRVLKVNASSDSLEPIDWPDMLRDLSQVQKQAVAKVEPWLQRDLAEQLRRLGSDAERFAYEVRDCPQPLWRDEVAFTVAHTPPEVLKQVSPARVLRENAQYLYDQDAVLSYADLVERAGPDGNYTTVSYVNYTGARHELPRDIYYYYLAHARVFWETPARVGDKSLWRKAFFNELEYQDSGTLEEALVPCTNVIEAVQNATVWVHKQTEFGYGTNPLQPVDIILDRYGSCGQYSITIGAAMKTAMVPARVSIYTASDHQWNEFWMDGNWTFTDAASDVAGQSRVREPELIPRTGSIKINDPDNFERTGWKPYMSALNSFRSDDVVHNSIDIVTGGPSFRYSKSNWSETGHPPPHRYTNTSHAHVTVVDGDGHPVEGAWVGVYRVGHYVYDANQERYPHFANANYTNATGQCDFELGLQGYCSRCEEDHGYAFEVLSHSGSKDLDRIEHIRTEGDDYSFTLTVDGDAPTPGTADWTDGTPPAEPELRLDLSIEAWGRQLRKHGEYGGHEVFAFGTTFDHTFPSDVDVLVLDGDALDILGQVGSPTVMGSWGGVERMTGSVGLPPGEDAYLVLLNLESTGSNKVVRLDLGLHGLCFPRLTIDSPKAGFDLSTANELIVCGTVRDHSPIVSLNLTLDDGTSWTDILAAYYEVNGTYWASLDVSDLPSGDHTIVVRAMDGEGVWREANASVFLDADDPVVVVMAPEVGTVLPAGEDVAVSGCATDNRELQVLRARIGLGDWTDLALPGGDGNFTRSVPHAGEAGHVPLEVEVRDGVGRTTIVVVDIVLDPTAPILEVRHPKPGDPELLGAVEGFTVEGSAWDDHGIASLRYSVDGGPWVESNDTLSGGGRFELNVSVAEWDDGDHTVELLLVDLAGHTDGATLDITLDTTPPSVSLAPLQETYPDDRTVELSGTVSDPHDVELVTISMDGDFAIQLVPDMLGFISHTLPWGSEAVGNHTVLLRAVDTLGNEVEVTLGYEVLDVTNPTLAIDTPTVGMVVPRGDVLTVSGPASDNVVVALLLLDVNGAGFVDRTHDYDPLYREYSITLETAGWDLGGVLLELRIVDGAGNEAIASVRFDLVDRTAPVLSLDIEPDVVPRVVLGYDLTIEGLASDDVGITRVEYMVDGGDWVSVERPSSEGNITLAVPTGTLVAGIHNLEVRVLDAAQNVNSTRASFQVDEPPEEGGIGGLVIALAVGIAVLILVAVFVLMRRRGPSPVPAQLEIDVQHEGDEVAPGDPGEDETIDDGPDASDQEDDPEGSEEEKAAD